MVKNFEKIGAEQSFGCRAILVSKSCKLRICIIPLSFTRVVHEGWVVLLQLSCATVSLNEGEGELSLASCAVWPAGGEKKL